ncbi:LAME_0G12816g1_1 [Lachancea meyersii CBS 8951]|uniref:LAME_0G12816g1_1 n=1 Tax=Lachancea meyersii CBS 8951 TaxID=1266667 RepID=A0A1G4K9W4_9SACH|nr:LAME_0G12816g1_1 [Lachancea meyersii CBS 8951]
MTSIVSTIGNEKRSYRKYTATPRYYNRKCVVNLALFILANAVCFYCTNNYLKWTTPKKSAIEAIFFTALLLIIRNPPVESLRVFRGAGIQVSTMRGCVLLPKALNNKWLEKSYFIPKDNIVDIIINEAFFKGFQVNFYLAVILKDITDLQLVFPVCYNKSEKSIRITASSGLLTLTTDNKTQTKRLETCLQ